MPFEQFVEGGSAGGGTQIAAILRNRRQTGRRNANLFREQRDESRVRLVRRKSNNLLAGNSTPALKLGNYLREFGDRRAGQRLSFEHDIETAIGLVLDANRVGKLRSATKIHFADDEGISWEGTALLLHNKRGSAVAKEAAELSSDFAGSKNAAVYIGRDDQDASGLSTAHKRLRDCQSMKQA